MDRPAVIPRQSWENLSEEDRAVIRAVIVGFGQQINDLKQQVQDLRARLDQNSTNISKPPSAKPIGVKRMPPAPPSKKRRDGQSVTDCKPTECRHCG